MLDLWLLLSVNVGRNLGVPGEEIIFQVLEVGHNHQEHYQEAYKDAWESASRFLT